MARKKKSDSLYELISSGKARQEDMEMNVPAWMSGQHKDDALEAPEQATEPVADPSQEPEPAEGSVAPPSPVVTAAGASVSSPSPASHGKDLPLVSTADGRLTFSLNHVSCVVVAVGLVLLLAGAFALGRVGRRGDKPVTAENGTENTQAGQGKSDSPAAAPLREAGKYYMIIQRLGQESKKARDEGERIVAFCAELGAKATVEPMPYNDNKTYLIVWSLEGHDSLKGKSNDTYANWIEGIGKMYFKKHRTHKFQQRVSPSAPLKPTFVPAN